MAGIPRPDDELLVASMRHGLAKIAAALESDGHEALPRTPSTPHSTVPNWPCEAS